MRELLLAALLAALLVAVATCSASACAPIHTPTPDAGDAGGVTVIVVAGVDAGIPSNPGF